MRARLQNLQSIPTFAIDMHGLAAALTVTLNVLLAASPAAGARAPTHTCVLARRQAVFARERFAKNKNSSLLENKNTPCKDI